MTSAPPSRFVATIIDRPADEVYAFVADPANLPQWAAGLSSGIEHVDGRWVTESPFGSVVVAMTPVNDLGVLDHTVTLPDGTAMLNPLRVVTLDAGSEIVFTVRRRPTQTPEEFEADVVAVSADLTKLKGLLESRDDAARA